MHAHQVTGGLFWHYKELDFSAEGYYKRMNNLGEYKDNGPVLPSFEGWEDGSEWGRDVPTAWN